MNKKDYVDAINEIRVGDKLKKETLNKIKKEKKFNFKYVLASASMLIVIAIGIISTNKLENKQDNPNNINIAKVQKTGLPKVDSFENLYNILELSKKKEIHTNAIKGIDMQEAEAITDTATNSESLADNSIGSDYSKTNNQVEGVDEADIVKTDGNYIYYISNLKIVIVNAKNPNELKIEAEIKYTNDKKERFEPEEMYINNDKLVVIGTNNIYKNNHKYYYDYDEFTVAKVYNIKNKNEVKLEREIEIEGYYLSSRMIEDNVYLLSNKYMYLYDYYGCKIEDLKEDDFKPRYRDTSISNETKYLNFDCICYFPRCEESSYLNIAAFNLNDNKSANIQSFLGAGCNIYSSKDNLYITKTNYEYKDYGIYNRYNVDTAIYKFNLSGTDVIYKNVGTVPGSILNQFSMDESNGYFRIATTDSKSWDSESNTNNLYILNDNLEIIGKLENLAKGERIYSVRFMGNRAYVVTFVQTDPLFVIDLSTPTNPTVLGELKIPGYSTYLHPYDENHLIGIGEDTQVKNYGYGEVVTTDGMKMSLFDVSDPNNPKEIYNVKIGEKGSYSEALNNHKAFLFSKEKNIIAFPATINKDDYNVDFQGVLIYGLNLKDGFTLKGKITHKDETERYTYDYTTNVERIIYINDTLFTLSRGMIKSVDLKTMQELSSLKIDVTERVYNYHYFE